MTPVCHNPTIAVRLVALGAAISATVIVAPRASTAYRIEPSSDPEGPNAANRAAALVGSGER